MEVESLTASTIFLPLYASPQHHFQCSLFSAPNCGALGSATDTRVETTLLVSMFGQEANYGPFISAIDVARKVEKNCWRKAEIDG